MPNSCQHCFSLPQLISIDLSTGILPFNDWSWTYLRGSHGSTLRGYPARLVDLLILLKTRMLAYHHRLICCEADIELDMSKMDEQAEST